MWCRFTFTPLGTVASVAVATLGEIVAAAGILGRSVRGANAGAIEGSGMGLSLVACIVSAHGGNVEIDSATGQGTIVTIRVPVVPA